MSKRFFYKTLVSWATLQFTPILHFKFYFSISTHHMYIYSTNAPYYSLEKSQNTSEEPSKLIILLTCKEIISIIQMDNNTSALL